MMTSVYSQTEVDNKGKEVTALMDAIAEHERIDVRSHKIDFVMSTVSPRYTCLPESLQKEKKTHTHRSILFQ